MLVLVLVLLLVPPLFAAVVVMWCLHVVIGRHVAENYLVSVPHAHSAYILLLLRFLPRPCEQKILKTFDTAPRALCLGR